MLRQISSINGFENGSKPINLVEAYRKNSEDVELMSSDAWELARVLTRGIVSQGVHSETRKIIRWALESVRGIKSYTQATLERSGSLERVVDWV